ncbi:MAG: hypothetical protein AAGA18_15625 [Verrucomicrobiota bacterium]
MRILKHTFLLSILCLYSCSQTSENTNELEDTQVSEESLEVSNETDPLVKYEREIKETLFQHFRAQVDGLNRYRYVKHEDISLSGDKVIYILVTLPESEVYRYNSVREEMTSSLVPVLDSKTSLTNVNDDSIRIEGQATIKDVIQTNLEKEVVSLKIEFQGQWKSSSVNLSPYGEQDRSILYDGFDAELIVDVAEPRIYNRDELYLKARIFELSKEDLSGFSKDELAYFRNELFATHRPHGRFHRRAFVQASPKSRVFLNAVRLVDQ